MSEEKSEVDVEQLIDKACTDAYNIYFETEQEYSYILVTEILSWVMLNHKEDENVKQEIWSQLKEEVDQLVEVKTDIIDENEKGEVNETD